MTTPVAAANQTVEAVNQVVQGAGTLAGIAVGSVSAATVLAGAMGCVSIYANWKDVQNKVHLTLATSGIAVFSLLNDAVLEKCIASDSASNSIVAQVAVNTFRSVRLVLVLAASYGALQSMSWFFQEAADRGQPWGEWIHNGTRRFARGLWYGSETPPENSRDDWKNTAYNTLSDIEKFVRQRSTLQALSTGVVMGICHWVTSDIPFAKHAIGALTVANLIDVFAPGYLKAAGTAGWDFAKTGGLAVTNLVENSPDAQNVLIAGGTMAGLQGCRWAVSNVPMASLPLDALCTVGAVALPCWAVNECLKRRGFFAKQTAATTAGPQEDWSFLQAKIDRLTELACESAGATRKAKETAMKVKNTPL